MCGSLRKLMRASLQQAATKRLYLQLETPAGTFEDQGMAAKVTDSSHQSAPNYPNVPEELVSGHQRRSASFQLRTMDISPGGFEYTHYDHIIAGAVIAQRGPPLRRHPCADIDYAAPRRYQCGRSDVLAGPAPRNYQYRRLRRVLPRNASGEWRSHAFLFGTTRRRPPRALRDSSRWLQKLVW